MNFILAFVLFGLYFVMQGVPSETSNKLFIANVIPGGAAEQAGLQKDDLVQSINGKPVGGDDMAARASIQESAGRR